MALFAIADLHLAGLKGKKIRFERVCDGSKMKETVLDMLHIKES